jgi:DNA-binding transcriptional LysR family regulator
MMRDELGDLVVFLAVAEERSFTRAAARLGTSQSSLSHTIRRLEERMGVRLLTRTTRNVAPTEAGEQLAETLRPAFNDIRTRLDSMTALRQKPAGNIRITSSRHATDTILMPAVTQLMTTHPDIKVEFSVDQRLTDLVTEHYDAGVRLGEQIEKDMIAVKIGPELRMTVVGSPAYFAQHPKPATPPRPDPACLHQSAAADAGRPLRLGVRKEWPSAERARRRPVHLQRRADHRSCGGQWPRACLSSRRRVSRPDRRRTPRPGSPGMVSAVSGYHLYYPSRRQASPAFGLLVEALRYRE